MISGRLPASADAVVIGGGIIGCSVAYHLRRRGVERIVLLERTPELGLQTSRAGAGFVSLWATEFSQDFHESWGLPPQPLCGTDRHHVGELCHDSGGRAGRR